MDNPPPTQTVQYQRHALAIATTLLVAVLFFSLTNPTKLPAIFFIVAFILVFGSAYAIATLLVYITAYLSGTVSHERFRLRVRAIKAAVAAIITVLLGLGSIGQLTVKDVLTLVVFFGILYFYVTRLARR